MATSDNQDIIKNHLRQLGNYAHNKLAEKDLAAIALLITNPDLLAPSLEITNPEQEGLRRDNPNLGMQKFQMLVLWRQKVGSKATLNNLVNILRDDGRVHLVEEILDHFLKKDGDAIQAQPDVVAAQSTEETGSRPRPADQEDISDANYTDGPLRDNQGHHRSPQIPLPPHQQQQQQQQQQNEEVIDLASSGPLENIELFKAEDLEAEYSKKLQEMEECCDKNIRKSSKVLIEVVNDTEFKTAICLMKGKFSKHHIKDELTSSTSTYYFGKWGDVPVIVVQTAKRSGPQFQYGSWFATIKALYYLPKLEYIFSVGVCGAITDPNTKSPRVPLGQVVISSHIIGYDHKKVLDGGQVNRSYSQNLTETDFYNFINKLGNQGNWRDKIHFGQVLSGSWLVASLAAQDFLVYPDEKDKIAVEMEGVGIAAATSNTKMTFLVIKGVSDYANSKKNDDVQPFAAREAASFLKDMLNEYPQTK